MALAFSVAVGLFCPHSSLSLDLTHALQLRMLNGKPCAEISGDLVVSVDFLMEEHLVHDHVDSVGADGSQIVIDFDHGLLMKLCVFFGVSFWTSPVLNGFLFQVAPIAWSMGVQLGV